MVRRRPLTLQAPLDPSGELAKKQDHIMCVCVDGSVLMVTLYLCKSDLRKERAEAEAERPGAFGPEQGEVNDDSGGTYDQQATETIVPSGRSQFVYF